MFTNQHTKHNNAQNVAANLQYLVAIPRNCFKSANAFSTKCRTRYASMSHGGGTLQAPVAGITASIPSPSRRSRIAALS